MKNIISALLAGFLSTVSVSAQHSPRIVAQWTFDSYYETTDLVNGWTSIITGNPTLTTGAAGYANSALKFNPGDFLRIPSHPKMNLKSWTIVALIRIDGFNSDACETNAILWRGNENDKRNFSLYYSDHPYDNTCNTYTPDKEVFAARAAGKEDHALSEFYTNNPSTDPFLKTGRWYCVAAMYSADMGKLSMYVDGIKVTDDLDWKDQYSYTSTTGDDLYIGSSNMQHSGMPFFMNATIDDLRIYDDIFTKNPPASPQGVELDVYCAYPLNVQTISPIIGFQVFPNPATDNITIAVPVHMQSGKIVIINAVGAVVKEVSATQGTIDTQELPTGLYIARLQSGKEIVTGKFTIVR